MANREAPYAVGEIVTIRADAYFFTSAAHEAFEAANGRGVVVEAVDGFSYLVRADGSDVVELFGMGEFVTGVIAPVAPPSTMWVGLSKSEVDHLTEFHRKAGQS